MPRREEEAIVLDAELSGEADRRVLLLTAEGELVRARAPSAARSQRRFGAALQPGSRIRARWSRRAEDAPAILEEALSLAPPPTPDPLERYYVACHALELAAAFAREGAEDPRLFRLLSATLERLAAGDKPAPLARYVEAWTLRLAGLLPRLDACEACGADLAGGPARLAGESGAFCAAHAPAEAQAVGAAAAEWLRATHNCPPGALPPLAGAAAADLERALPELIVSFTERPLRALAALRRLQRL